MDRQLPPPPPLPLPPQQHDRMGPMIHASQQPPNPASQPHQVQGYAHQAHGYHTGQTLPQAQPLRHQQYQPQQQEQPLQHQRHSSGPQQQLPSQHQGQSYLPIAAADRAPSAPVHLQPVTVQPVRDTTRATSPRTASLPEHLRPRPQPQQPRDFPQAALSPEKLQQRSEPQQQQQRQPQAVPGYTHSAAPLPPSGPSAPTVSLPAGLNGAVPTQGASQHAAAVAPTYPAQPQYTGGGGGKPVATAASVDASAAASRGAAPAAAGVHQSGAAASQQAPAWYAAMQPAAGQQQPQQLHVTQLTGPPQQQIPPQQQHLAGYTASQVQPMQLQPQLQSQLQQQPHMQQQQQQQQPHMQQQQQQLQSQQAQLLQQQLQQQQLNQQRLQQQQYQQQQLQLQQQQYHQQQLAQQQYQQQQQLLHHQQQQQHLNQQPQLQQQRQVLPQALLSEVKVQALPGQQPLPTSLTPRQAPAPQSAGGMAANPEQLEASRYPGSAAIPVHLKPAAVGAGPPSAGFVQLVEQLGGIQVDLRGGLRLVGVGDTSTAGGPEAPSGSGAPQLHSGPVPMGTQMRQHQEPSLALQPQQYQHHGPPDPQMYGLPQPVGAPAWAEVPRSSGSYEVAGRYGPPAGDEQHYRPAERPQYPQQPAPRSYADVSATAGSAGARDDGRVPARAAANRGGAAAVVMEGPATERPAAAAAAPSREAAMQRSEGEGPSAPSQQPTRRKPREEKPPAAAPAPAAEKPPPPLADAIRLCEALERTVANTREDTELLTGMLPQLLLTCKTRMADLGRAIGQAKAEEQERRSAEAAKAAASAAAAAGTAARGAAGGSGSDDEDLGEVPPGHVAYLLERSIRTLWPLDTPEHELLRVCAEVLLLEVGSRTASANLQEIPLQPHQLLGSALCKNPAVMKARPSVLGSAAIILRQHEAFEVLDLTDEKHPTNKQWLIRLRTECLPSYSAVCQALRVAVDVFLPEPSRPKQQTPPPKQTKQQQQQQAPSGSGRSGSGAVGRSGSGCGSEEVPQKLLDLPDADYETSEEREVLRCIALHLIKCKSAAEGLFNDRLQKALWALPKHLAKPYASDKAGMDKLRQLLLGHPFFGVSNHSGCGVPGATTSREPDWVRLAADTLLHAQYRVRRLMLRQEQQLQQVKKRKGADGSAAVGVEGQELVDWWMEQRKKHPNRHKC